MRARQDALVDRLGDALKAAAGTKEPSWEQREVLHDVKQGFQAQADSLRQSVAALKENIDRMKRQGAIGSELAQKFDVVRKAMDDLLKAYGDSLLNTMKDFDKPVSLKDIRQAVDKVRAALPKFDEQLDIALKYLRMLKEDRRIAELAMRAEQLSKEQTTLAHGDSSGSVAAKRQQELLDQMKQLSGDISQQAHAGSPAKGAMDSLSSKNRLDSLRSAWRRPCNGSAPLLHGRKWTE